MPTIPCPACGLPRAEDLFETVPCPLCGHAGPRPEIPTEEGEPESDLPWVILESPPRHAANDPGPIAEEITPPSGGRRRAGVLAGFLVGVAAGVGGTTTWPVVRDSLSLHFSIETVGIDSTQTEQQREPTPSTAEASADVPTAPDPLPPAAPVASVPVSPASVPPTPKQTVVIGRPAEPAPFNPFRPAAAPAKRLDDNVDTYGPNIPPGGSLVVRGRVKRLIVTGLEAGAVLDASELETKEVVVVGPVEGGSRLSVRAPDGRIRFLARVDARSVIDVKAPGGQVVFENATEFGRDGSKIDGGSRVDVTARDVRFAGQITGAGTRVFVTLTRGGGLSFAEVAGAARLEYRRAVPTDPEPVVVRGTVRSPAVVAKAE